MLKVHRNQWISQVVCSETCRYIICYKLSLRGGVEWNIETKRIFGLIELYTPDWFIKTYEKFFLKWSFFSRHESFKDHIGFPKNQHRISFWHLFAMQTLSVNLFQPLRRGKLCSTPDPPALPQTSPSPIPVVSRHKGNPTKTSHQIHRKRMIYKSFTEAPTLCVPSVAQDTKWLLAQFCAD